MADFFEPLVSKVGSMLGVYDETKEQDAKFNLVRPEMERKINAALHPTDGVDGPAEAQKAVVAGMAQWLQEVGDPTGENSKPALERLFGHVVGTIENIQGLQAGRADALKDDKRYRKILPSQLGEDEPVILRDFNDGTVYVKRPSIAKTMGDMYAVPPDPSVKQVEEYDMGLWQAPRLDEKGQIPTTAEERDPAFWFGKRGEERGKEVLKKVTGNQALNYWLQTAEGPEETATALKGALTYLKSTGTDVDPTELAQIMAQAGLIPESVRGGKITYGLSEPSIREKKLEGQKIDIEEDLAGWAPVINAARKKAERRKRKSLHSTDYFQTGTYDPLQEITPEFLDRFWGEGLGERKGYAKGPAQYSAPAARNAIAGLRALLKRNQEELAKLKIAREGPVGQPDRPPGRQPGRPPDRSPTLDALSLGLRELPKPAQAAEPAPAAKPAADPAAEAEAAAKAEAARIKAAEIEAARVAAEEEAAKAPEVPELVPSPEDVPRRPPSKLAKLDLSTVQTNTEEYRDFERGIDPDFLAAQMQVTGMNREDTLKALYRFYVDKSRDLNFNDPNFSFMVKK